MSDWISLKFDEDLAIIRLNRPERRNALSTGMWEMIAEFVREAEMAAGVKALVLESAVEGVFSAGADLGDMKRAMTDIEFANRNLSAIKNASRKVAACQLPTVALVDGMCFGGATALIAAADIRLAGPDAVFATTPAKLGLAYPISDTARLVTLMGPARTKRMIFTGDQINAETALIYGLVDDVLMDFKSEARGFINHLTARSLYSQTRLKEQLGLIESSLETQDDQLFIDTQSGEDAREGIAAFAEKRQPVFSWHPNKKEK